MADRPKVQEIAILLRTRMQETLDEARSRKIDELKPAEEALLAAIEAAYRKFIPAGTKPNGQRRLASVISDGRLRIEGRHPRIGLITFESHVDAPGLLPKKLVAKWRVYNAAKRATQITPRMDNAAYIAAVQITYADLASLDEALTIAADKIIATKGSLSERS